MTLYEIRQQIAALQEELDFYRSNSSDFNALEYADELISLNTQLNDLYSLEAEFAPESEEDLMSFEDFMAAELTTWAEETFPNELPQQTVDVVAVTCDQDGGSLLIDAMCGEADFEDDDAWLDEELDNMIHDPAGTRFQRDEVAPETAENPSQVSEPQTQTFTPYFPTYVHFLMWVTHQAIRGITYIIRNVNEIFVSSQTTQLATWILTGGSSPRRFYSAANQSSHGNPPQVPRNSLS